jgi:hypothetical protein
VNFAIAKGSGTVSPTSAVTDAAGKATTSWSTQKRSGSEELHVSVSGLNTVIIGSYVAGPAGTIGLVDAGRDFTCVLNRNEIAFCTGENRLGQLGIAEDGQLYRVPTRVVDLDPLAQLATGMAHACGTTVTTGATYCWGSNSQGQLGDGTRGGSFRPVLVKTADRFVELAAGEGHTCGRTLVGSVSCWGANSSGQLGTFTDSVHSSVPVPVANELIFSAIAAGARHTCGLNHGTAYCWGANDYYQLGRATEDDFSVEPVEVGVPEALDAITAAGDHTCALAGSGTAYCWGENGLNQLGTGKPTVRELPLDVPAPVTFVKVSTGEEASCAISDPLDSSRVYCWGSSSSGGNTIVALPNQEDIGFVEIQVGRRHQCARSQLGLAYCSFQNDRGQWGNGTGDGWTGLVPALPVP